MQPQSSGESAWGWFYKRKHLLTQLQEQVVLESHFWVVGSATSWSLSSDGSPVLEPGVVIIVASEVQFGA